MHAYSGRRGSALSYGPLSCAVARALAVIALTLRAAAPSHKIRTHVHVINSVCALLATPGLQWGQRGRVPAISICNVARVSSTRLSGNRVVAKLGGVCVLDLSSIYRVASHTRVHRLPSGKIVGRQGETTGFILHKSCSTS